MRRRSEHVGDEPGILVQSNATAVADGDAGSLLAAVLQGEQGEEDGLGDALAVWRRHPEHSALLVGRIGEGRVRRSVDWLVRQHAQGPP